MAGAPAPWSQVRANDLEARCVVDRVLVGYLRGSELVMQVLSPALGPEQRIRLAPHGIAVTAQWRAATIDERFVTVHRTESHATELLRVVAGRITHRSDLGLAGSVTLAISDAAVLVATNAVDGLSATLGSFSRADLTPGPTATISSPAGHGVAVDGVWPGPQGRVAVAVGEGWTHMMANYHTSSLRLWAPATGTLSASVEIGARDRGAGAWLGARFVLAQGAHAVTPPGPYPIGMTPRVERIEPARVMRFDVAP